MPLKNWTIDEINAAMQANMHQHMTYFSTYEPSLRLLSEPDVTVIQSPIPDDTFNYVLSAKFTSDNVANRVKHVIALYTNPKLPFSWWVSSFDTPKQLTSALLTEGLFFKEENIGMYLDLSQCILPEDSSNLNFTQVLNLPQMRDFTYIIESIGGSTEAYEKLYSKVPLSCYQQGASFEMHIATLHNIPVVSGLIVFYADVAGLYYVATTPDQRKKGYGTAMMTYLLKRAQSRNYQIATLQASSEGKTLYERLGFKESCSFKEYALPYIEEKALGR